MLDGSTPRPRWDDRCSINGTFVYLRLRFCYHKIRSAKCRYLNLHRLGSSLWLVLVLQLETISYHLPFATLDGLPPKDIPLIGTMSPVRIAGRKKSMGFLAGFVEFEDKKKNVWKIFPPLCQSQNNIMLMKLRGWQPLSSISLAVLTPEHAQEIFQIPRTYAWRL